MQGVRHDLPGPDRLPGQVQFAGGLGGPLQSARRRRDAATPATVTAIVKLLRIDASTW
ncbi:MAG TPA: hypothetical protein VN408_01385 [Actinoplanes sp.]|nr:hypothetical protein [Actinoplanes sp.]